MIHLINCDIIETPYMGDSMTSEKLHVVDAETKEEAIKKLRDRYEEKSDPYSTSYWININYCHELIT